MMLWNYYDVIHNDVIMLPIPFIGEQVVAKTACLCAWRLTSSFQDLPKATG